MILLEDSALNLAFTGVLGNIRNGCLLLIPLLLLLKTAWHLLKGFTSDLQIHYQGLLGGGLLWILVACYPEVIKYLDILCQSVVSFVAPPVEDPVTAVGRVMYARKALSNLNEQNEWDNAVKQIEGGNVLSGAGAALSNVAGSFVKSIKDTGEDWMAGLLSIFASLARMVIETIRAILLQFLIAVGPLALTFSILDGFGHVSRYWLQKLVSVYLWSLTLNILDHIVIDYYSNIALIPEISTLQGNQVQNSSPYFMDQLIVGGMYMMVPWLTSSFLGGTNAGQFLGNNVRLLTSVVSTTITAAKAIATGKN